MAKRSAIAQVVLWLFVISAGIVTGGSIFEHTVLTPLWAGSPPESVTQWQYGGIQGKFFRIASPTYALCSLALLVVSWWMPRQQRKWALVAGLSGIIAMVWTIVFFLPILGKTQATRGAGLSGEEITALVTQFKAWNWGRWAVLIGGWIAGLRAFSMSSTREARSRDII
jgi:hypothetical protein